MNKPGFYKQGDEEIFYASSLIQAPGYVLFAVEKDLYEYPVDGWIWAESEEDAIAYFDSVDLNAV